MHDANGTPLKVGDKVIIPGVVTQLSPMEDYCNVSVETTLGRKPDGEKNTFGAINTAQIVKVATAEKPIGL
jgi:hypothetical protein